jgi:16S rRNA (cytidine1402-2'-O)-methyltransferase
MSAPGRSQGLIPERLEREGSPVNRPVLGRLVLVPNALDLGAVPQPLSEVLPHGVIAEAAQLTYWLVEDAKSARAFIKRVGEIVPLREALQAHHISELPRPAKGRPATPNPGHGPDADTPYRELLAPTREGHDIGLLSEAGLPAVADPGAAVVAAAHAIGVPVRVLPGPSSLLLALAASGLNGQSFAFVGYLPQEAAARAASIRGLEANSRRLKQTQIFIETPYRNPALLAALLEHASAGTRLSVSVGLTLPEAWSRTATIAEWRRGAPALGDRTAAVFLLQA